MACSYAMPDFMPGIHVFAVVDIKDVDGRDKPARDGLNYGHG
jgi:hypothetical protein